MEEEGRKEMFEHDVFPLFVCLIVFYDFLVYSILVFFFPFFLSSLILLLSEERALAAEERARLPPPRRPWTVQRACSYVVPLIIVSVGVIALVFALGRNGNGPMSIPTIGDVTNPGIFFVDNDPWEGIPPSEVMKWRSSGTGGLKLTVLDALDGSEWEDIFHETVGEWEDGQPRVLDLATEKMAHDPNCEAVDGRSKVCNGNYGQTDWRGINQVNIQNGYIYSTTSRMNEYYLNGASVAQKQYTMCHGTYKFICLIYLICNI